MRRIFSLFLTFCMGTACLFAGSACGEQEKQSSDAPSERAYYFDSENGNDDNDGSSPEKAFQTLFPLYRMEKVEPGTELCFKGTFSGNISFKGSGTEEEPIVLKSYGEKRAVIDGRNRLNCFYLFNQSNIVVDNMEFTLDEEGSTKRNGIYVYADSGIVGGITVKNCYLHDITGSFIKYDYYSSAAIYFNYEGDISPENRFDDILIENTKIENVIGIGIGISDNAEGIDDDSVHPYCENVVIRNVTIDGTSNDGIILKQCYKPVVEYCKILNVGKLFPDPNREDYYHCAVWSCATESPLYQFNEVAYTTYVDGDGQAFDTDWGSRGTGVWQYNYTHDNEGGVLLRHENFSGIFRNNVSINDGNERVGRGLIFHSFIEEGDGLFEAENNIFYNDGYDLHIAYGFTDYSCTTWEKKDSELNVFRKNIFAYRNTDMDWGNRTIYEGNAYICLNGDTSAPKGDGNAHIGNPFVNEYKQPAEIREIAEIFALSAEAEEKGFGIEDITKFVVEQSGANF